MRKVARCVHWLDDAVLKFTLAVSGTILVLMVAVAGLGVLTRFVFHASLSWSEELDAYLFVWLTCLGAAAGVKLHAHPCVQALADRLPVQAQGLTKDVTDFVVVALGLILAIYGGAMISLMGTETASSLPISMIYPYLAIPVGGALLIVHSLAHLIVSHLAPEMLSRDAALASHP
jgi:TRAP-type C4-dicarboxylate transport system permease small subunit